MYRGVFLIVTGAYNLINCPAHIIQFSVYPIVVPPVLGFQLSLIAVEYTRKKNKIESDFARNYIFTF